MGIFAVATPEEVGAHRTACLLHAHKQASNRRIYNDISQQPGEQNEGGGAILDRKAFRSAEGQSTVSSRLGGGARCGYGAFVGSARSAIDQLIRSANEMSLLTLLAPEVGDRDRRKKNPWEQMIIVYSLPSARDRRSHSSSGIGRHAESIV
jgi:hypothetical protein